MNKPILDKSLSITRGALPGSRKLIVPLGNNIFVPFREVPLSGGEEPVRLYDTSGPYTMIPWPSISKRAWPPAAVRGFCARRRGRI